MRKGPLRAVPFRDHKRGQMPSWMSESGTD